MFDLLRAAGKHLCVVRITQNYYADESFRAVAGSMQNLEQCTVHIPRAFMRVGFLEHMFATPKNSLSKLVLTRTFLYQYPRQGKSNVLDIVAQGTFVLRELECTTSEPVTGAHADKLLKANRE